MSTPLPTSPDDANSVSFSTGEHASLVIHTPEGTLTGWPLHLLNEWSLVTGSTEAEVLNINIASANIAVRGERLKAIAVELATLRVGLDLYENNERYRALANKSDPWITHIEVAKVLP
jgi:hypothetical protein